MNNRARTWVSVAAITIPIMILAAVLSNWRGQEAEQVGERLSGELASSADKQGEFAVQQAAMGDFDAGQQVPSHSSQADFWYEARSGSDRYFVVREGAQLAIAGRVDSPTLKQVKKALEQPVEEVDLNQMSPGLWIAVRTSQGNFAAFTIKSHAGISPGVLRLSYLLWQE